MSFRVVGDCLTLLFQQHMKAFLKNILLFSSLFLGFVAVVDIASAALLDEKAEFKLASQPKYLLLGHSHPECAFNDSLIPQLKNMGRSGESYYYTYYKAKKLLEQNPSVETVLIECTNNQINREMDAWVWEDQYLSEQYTTYAAFIPLRDQYVLLQHNLKGYPNALSVSNRFKMTALLWKEYDFSHQIGGYLYLVRDKTEALLESMDTLYTKSKRSSAPLKAISETNLLYLEKTIALAQQHHKKVILLRSPQHPNYKGYHNEVVYQNMLHTRFGSLDYMDFSDFPLSNDQYGDLDHLNHKGAKVFSGWFGGLVADGLLQKSDKQRYIQEKIKTYTDTQKVGFRR